jgi:hypothetical protein
MIDIRDARREGEKSMGIHESAVNATRLPIRTAVISIGYGQDLDGRRHH